MSMISGLFRDYYCGLFGYCSKHYIFKTYFLRVDGSFNENNVNCIINHLNNTDVFFLYDLHIDQSNYMLTSHIHNSLDICATVKEMKIPYKNVFSQPWITAWLLQSTKARDKLHTKSLDKPKSSQTYINFINY